MPTPCASHLFLLDRERLSHLELPLDDVLESARRELVCSLLRPRNDQRRRSEQDLSRRLAELLLPDEAQVIMAPWRSCSIVGTDLLGVVPCELLPLRDGTLLGDRLALDRLPSLSVALALGASPAEALRWAWTSRCRDLGRTA